MARAKVSSKGQIVLPKAIRDRLSLAPGTELSIDVQGQRLVVRRLVRDFPDWRTMRGMVKTGPSMTGALEEEHASELARDDTRLQSH